MQPEQKAECPGGSGEERLQVVKRIAMRCTGDDKKTPTPKGEGMEIDRGWGRGGAGMAGVNGEIPVHQMIH